MVVGRKSFVKMRFFNTSICITYKENGEEIVRFRSDIFLYNITDMTKRYKRKRKNKDRFDNKKTLLILNEKKTEIYNKEKVIR